MGVYKFLNKLWKDKKEIKSLFRERMIKWRKENSVVKLENPTRLDKARALGYKAKEGILVVRVRVKRGGRQKEQIRKGRRSKRRGRRKIVGKSYQWVAEERANKKFRNFNVLNSYYLSQDGKHYWFEVILVDKSNPAIRKDKHLKWMCRPKHRGRAFRGLTAAGRRSRGILTHKGKGTEKLRPSLRKHSGRGK